jgi:serine/threonine-protein kinase
LLLGVLAGLAIRGDTEAGNHVPTQLSVVFPGGVRVLRLPGPAIAISSDGRTLALVGTGADGQRIYLRSLSMADPVPLAGTEGGASPFFSPDGEWIGFYADGMLMRVPTVGGTPITITEAPGEPLGASWGRDNTIVFSVGYRSGLRRVAADGGAAEQATVLDTASGEVSHRLPHFLPNEREVMYTALTANGNYLYAQDLLTGHRVRVRAGDDGKYAASGHLVYGERVGTAASLIGVPFDPTRLEVTGTARPVLDDVAARTTGVVQYAISSNGTLGYIPGSSTTVLTLVDSDGMERSISLDGERFSHPRFSPTGDRVAVGVYQNGQFDIWIFDLTTQQASRLTFNGGASPVWTPDGQAVAFATGPLVGAGEARGILVRRVDGMGGEEIVTPLGPRTWHSLGDWTRSGDSLVYDASPEGASVQIELAVDGQSIPMLHDAGVEFRDGRLSPDGRWLAYQSNETGRNEIYVTTFPAAGGRWQVSNAGGTDPIWGPSGTELLYVSEERMLAATLVFEPSVRVIDRRVKQDVFAPHWMGDYDVHPDGNLYALARIGGPAALREVVVILDWFDELGELIRHGSN